ncbi:mannose-6-phosphate isomerase, partial [bacterium]
MNLLYPLKFKPIIKDKIWGGTRLKSVLQKKTKTDKAGESWEISGYPGSVSKVSNGFLAGNSLEEIIEVYMGDLVGDSIFETYGTLFPLLIKFIDANDALSVQVHPNDALAEKQFGSFGKTEMWYIIEAEKDAEIIVGFNRQVDRNIYEQHLKGRTLLEILNKEKT